MVIEQRTGHLRDFYSAAKAPLDRGRSDQCPRRGIRYCARSTHCSALVVRAGHVPRQPNLHAANLVHHNAPLFGIMASTAVIIGAFMMVN